MLLMMKELLRKLPSVDEILKENRTRQWLASHPRTMVLEAVRTVLDRRRSAILQPGEAKPVDEKSLSLPSILDAAETLLNELSEPSLQPVINATGVVVHTNLGRSILSREAIRRVVEAAGPIPIWNMTSRQ